MGMNKFMRQPDFFSGAARLLTPTQASAPTAATNGGSGPASLSAAGSFGSFGNLLLQVRTDVDGFIRHGEAGATGGSGNGTPSTAATALSPEAQVYLNRAQPASAPVPATIDATQEQFLASIKPWTEETGQKLGVAPEIIAAHAALESGWGQRPLRQSNGGDTNNLFGVKAGGQWRGEVAAALTTEYDHGSALKTTARFRSYPDQASAFRDYAQVLLGNPRYRSALGAGSDARVFADGLARGGYATDPAYADKLTRLANRLQQATPAATAVQISD